VQDLLYTYDFSRQDGNGHTPLHKTCQYGHVSIVKTLLSVFAPPATTNNWGNTAGQLADLFGNGELAPIMIPANTSPLDCGISDPRAGAGARSEPAAAQAGTGSGTSGATAAAPAAEAKVNV
jgi:ankyrin repeat protein